MTNQTAATMPEIDTDSAGQGFAPAERVRALNDELRTTGAGGRTSVTPGLLAKGPDFVDKAMTAVRAFDAFSDDNDPWQEHDCATLDVDGESVLFKIDYYDENMQFGSPDPADPKLTRRVLTVMLAEEY